MEPTPSITATYNVLHNLPDDQVGEETPTGDHQPFLEDQEAYDDDDDDYDHSHQHKHKHEHKEVLESFDFTDSESMMWRKVGFKLFCSQYIEFTKILYPVAPIPSLLSRQGEVLDGFEDINILEVVPSYSHWFTCGVHRWFCCSLH